MSIPIAHPQSNHHNLRDWLDLHGLDHQTCRHLLDDIKKERAEIPADGDIPDLQSAGLNPDEVWTKVVSATCSFLPEHQSVIEETFERSTKIAVAARGKSRKALTIDHGPAKYPTIMYNYFDEISDLFVVAHEFGHALQIRASEGLFMPPVMRETCAFLLEGAILSSCLKESAYIAENSVRYWRKSNKRYFGSLATRLEKSLKNDSVIYEYDWNYPIARFLALRISAQFSRDLIWSVFSGSYSTKRVLDQLLI